MEKNYANLHFRQRSAGNLFKKMKLLFAFFFAGLFGVSASTYSQQTKLSINLNGVSVKEAFKQIEKKSEFVFFYNEDNIDVDRKVKVNANDEKIETILNELLEGTKNTYKIYDRQIVILAAEVEVAQSAIKPIAKAEQSKKISGSVSDNKGVPLPGVNVFVKGTVIGTLTDSDGKFQLSVPADAKILVFSFIGMNKKEVALTGLTIFNVVLEENLSSIDEIVTIGYATQAKSDVTSSISTISEKEFNDRTIINRTSCGLQDPA